MFRIKILVAFIFATYLVNALPNKGTKDLRIDWQADSSTSILWAINCDFPGGDLFAAPGPGEICGTACRGVGECSHYSWTNYNGGTCWLKTGYVQISDAQVNYEASCGIDCTSGYALDC